MIYSIDPGRDKTGLAIYDPMQRAVVDHRIVATRELIETLHKLQGRHALETFLLGDGTHSVELARVLQQAFPAIVCAMVDETNSTLEARTLYFKLHPPKGLKRLIPLTMQVPPEPVDDLVAIILLHRHLGHLPEIVQEN